MLRLIGLLAFFATACADQLVIPCANAVAHTQSTDIWGHTFQATECDGKLVVIVGNIQE